MVSIKNIIIEMRKLENQVTTSDLQGIATAKSMKIGIKKQNNLNEADNIILGYAYGEIDINSANRFLTDILMKDRGTK